MSGKHYTDVKCGDWSCEREAAWLPAGTDTFESLRAKFVQVNESRDKKYRTEVTTEDVENSLAGALKCNVHKAAALRVKYRTPTTFIPASDRPDVLQAARNKQARDKAHRQEVAAQKAAENRAHHERVTDRYWQELAEEPDYVLQYEEEKRYTSKVTRRWAIYTSDVLAKQEEDIERNYRYRTVANVEVFEDQPYDDIVRPVQLRLSISSHVSAKLAPFIAEALTKGAEMVNAMNERLLAEHAEKRKGWG